MPATYPSFIPKEQIRITQLFSLFQIHYDKTFQYLGESHDFWECLYVVEGSVCVSADERVYNLSKGELIFHKPLEFHKFYIDNENGADILVFSFSMTGALCNYFRDKVFRLSFHQKNILSAMVEYIQSKLKETPQPEEPDFYNRYLSPVHQSETYSQMLITYLCQLFLSLAEAADESEVSDSPEAKILKQAVDYMNDHIGSTASVSEIAAYCSISEAGLKRVFQKYAGIGIHKYFLQLKIKNATILLQKGYSVNETAEMLGFGSQSYFSAAYKRETGISPSQIK